MTDMARIWGAVSRSGAGEAAATLAGHWSRRTGRTAADLGRFGATTPGALAHDPGTGLTVAVDGFFLDAASAAGPPRPPAEIALDRVARLGFVAALETFDGDFAIAVHDARSGDVWLGRDRFGVRPLYFATPARDAFAFASQPLGLAELPGVGRGPDPRFLTLFAASHYRTFDNDACRSPYAAVSQVPAAHWVRWTDGAVSIGRYWALTECGDLDLPEAELAARYRELLYAAVQKRLALAPRRAFTLSGGMDSSSVLATAVALEGTKQAAFSTVYEDATYDESDDIATILDTTVSHWEKVPIGTPDVFSIIDRMVAIHDEPVATATWLSHHELCRRLQASRYPAVFTGLGGDELNAGEYEHFFFFFADLRAAGRDDLLSAEIAAWQRHHDHPVFRKSREVAYATMARVTDPLTPGRCLPERSRIARYAAALANAPMDLATFAPVMDGPFTSYLKNRTYQDIFRETAPCCLRAQDRHGFAYGVTHLNPFYDRDLVEFLFRVPGTLKVRDGVTKHLLRQAMRGTLPEPTRTRIKKTGWNAPAHIWFTGENADRLLDAVRSQRIRELDLYDAAEIERLVAEHAAIVTGGPPRDNHMMFLWQVANLTVWVSKG
jgi:asparagine synthase (glutamine-hydrolysing)